MTAIHLKTFPTPIGQILAILAANGQTKVSDLFRQSEFSAGKLYPHVRTLERDRVIVRHCEGRYGLAETIECEAYLESYDIGSIID